MRRRQKGLKSTQINEEEEANQNYSGSKYDDQNLRSK
jgi:hypothetical protein